ncbi:MAG TPA: methylmalonyl Co-A mutase-associated GTPase MeaB [Desulfosalsimonadaceae bacterium]|nr:methylmalonyl Co-A mutase-associated GTPase MeaB [Desulfosalsimonadaceae bacterium]
MEADPEYFIQGVRAGDRKILAKTITLIESSLATHQQLVTTVLDELLPDTGNTIRLGITGVPGAGKSTFIENMGLQLIDQGYRLAVLAVDPSSARSGGSILGDKTRMEKLSARPEAFIRPSPSGGSLGGVSRKTREAMLICEAAGFDVIIVETVGVGQSEASVASMVDFFLVLILAGAGDELQGIKRGILELADAIAVNKADGENIENAKKTRKQYEDALHLLTPSSSTWVPSVLTCSALTMSGIEEIWHTVLNHRQQMIKSGDLAAKRKRQALDWMQYLLEEGLKEWFYSTPQVRHRLPELKRAVEVGETTPTAAVKTLLDIFTRPKERNAYGSQC